MYVAFLFQYFWKLPRTPYSACFEITEIFFVSIFCLKDPPLKNSTDPVLTKYNQSYVVIECDVCAWPRSADDSYTWSVHGEPIRGQVHHRPFWCHARGIHFALRTVHVLHNLIPVFAADEQVSGVVLRQRRCFYKLPMLLFQRNWRFQMLWVWAKTRWWVMSHYDKTGLYENPEINIRYWQKLFTLLMLSFFLFMSLTKTHQR